jgi:hypothetical protein
VNKFDQFKMETRRAFRTLEGRIAGLEAERKPKRKRAKAPGPTNAIISERKALWGRFLVLHKYFHRREATILWFTTHYVAGLDPSEFSRWLSAGVKKGIAPGGTVDGRIRRALLKAVAELEARAGKDAGHATFSHETLTNSHVAGARPN